MSFHLSALALALLLALLPPGGTFIDDDGSVHEGGIEALAAAGITTGCNPPTNNRFCPRDPVTRGQMAAFISRSLELAPSNLDFFIDDAGHLFESAINRLAAAGITLGCNPPANDRFCPDREMRRGEMAAMLVRAFDYQPTPDNRFSDDDGHIFENAINRLAAAGVTLGCNPPTNDLFCPGGKITREEMATFLTRSLGLTANRPPPRTFPVVTVVVPVICVEVLEHCVEPWTIIDAVEGMVKEGGQVVITTPYGAWEPLSFEMNPDEFMWRNHIWLLDKAAVRIMFGDKPSLLMTTLLAS